MQQTPVIPGPLQQFCQCKIVQLYLQQDLGHQWDLGDQLVQEDPEHKQEKVAITTSQNGHTNVKVLMYGFVIHE